jgi:hypothetical protein
MSIWGFFRGSKAKQRQWFEEARALARRERAGKPDTSDEESLRHGFFAAVHRRRLLALQALFEGSRYDDCIQAATTIATLEPELQPDCEYLIGLSWRGKGDFGRAIEHYAQAVLSGFDSGLGCDSIDESRAAAKLSTELRRREVVFAALAASILDELWAELWPDGAPEKTSTQLIRAELLRSYQVSPLALPDLMECMERDPDRADVVARMAEATAAIGIEQGIRLSAKLPVGKLGSEKSQEWVDDLLCKVEGEAVGRWGPRLDLFDGAGTRAVV